MGLTILIERQWWGEQEANLQNMMRLCFVMSQSSYFGSGVSSDAMVTKSLIDLNEKASGQYVTDIGAPAATMEIVDMYHTKMTYILLYACHDFMVCPWSRSGHLVRCAVAEHPGRDQDQVQTKYILKVTYLR